MSKSKSKFLPLLCVLFGLALASGAQAQATRTWVSGVGDDVNPCSRTAPCKTFAGAISKTAAGGEISVLDPGGFGTINITKAITINGEGTLGSILASSVNGVIVNAGANDVVVLRHLSINGAGTTLGTNGIRFLAGKELHVERVQIHNFSQNGIDFEPTSTNSSLFVNDSIITNINAGNATDKAGLLVKPGLTGQAFAVLNNTRIEGGRIGILVQDRGRVVLDNCMVSRNAVLGAWVNSASAAATLFSKDSSFAHNGPVFTFTIGTGVRSEGANASIRLANTLITGSEQALLPVSSGAILSYGDNDISGNVADGAPTGFITDL